MIRDHFDFLYSTMPLYTEADVANALADVANRISLRKASTIHRVPRTTLIGRLNGSNGHRTAAEPL